MGFLADIRPLGENASTWVGKVLELIPSEFLTSPTTAKIVSLIIYAGGIWLVLHFAGALKKPVKVVLIGLLALLMLSVIATFTGN